MKIPDEKIINVGVIGCGFGWFHIEAISDYPDHSVRVKTICDQSSEKLAMVKGWLGSKADGVVFTQNSREIMDDPDIDVVCISLPHHLHLPFVKEAAAAGKNIMLDKPMARNESEAAEIVEAVNNAGIQAMVAFNFRYHPQYQAMQQAIASGRIGKVLLSQSRHYQRFYPAENSNWRNRESIGGGAIMGSGVHNIDFMRFCLGDPEEVYACAVNDYKRLDAEAGASVIFRYASGTVVNFFCNWCKSSTAVDAARKFGEWEFFGDNGELRLHEDGVLRICRLDNSAEELICDSTSQFLRQWEHFADCLRSGKTPLTNMEESFKTQHLIAKVYESMRSGRPEKV
ncbi:MAG: Gfo/Idh/MocA family oxidoreductase [Lentisphaerae bacterium]|nr:Gfo/Idh/MocA family oxidoreductase [Lentisphaerota bacterium]